MVRRLYSTMSNKPVKPGVRYILNNLASDISSAAAHALKTGEISASPQLVTSRFSICKSNKCGKFDGKTCQMCGCHMVYKTKLITSKCPKGLW